MKPKRPRRSAFVPHLLVRTVVVGVVPACAAAACGSSDNARPDQFFSVGAVAYPAYESGVGIVRGVLPVAWL